MSPSNRVTTALSQWWKPGYAQANRRELFRQYAAITALRDGIITRIRSQHLFGAKRPRLEALDASDRQL